MSLDKAIEHGKERRKPYRGSKAIDPTCRNHGGCVWCEIKQKTLTDAQIKHSNKCRDFEFCSMDVYDENRTYQPRQKKQKPLAVMLGEQMMMNFGKGVKEWQRSM